MTQAKQKTTTPPIHPQDVRLEALLEMESSIADAWHSIGILVDRVEDMFQESHADITGSKEKWYIPQEEIELLLFAAYQARMYSRKVREEFHAA